MQRRLIGFLSLSLVLALTAPAVASDVDHPGYKYLAGWGDRSTVTSKTEVVEEGKTTAMSSTVTLKSVAADKLIIELALTTEVNGQKMQMPAMPGEVPAKHPKLPYATKETKGRET